MRAECFTLGGVSLAGITLLGVGISLLANTAAYHAGADRLGAFLLRLTAVVAAMLGVGLLILSALALLTARECWA